MNKIRSEALPNDEDRSESESESETNFERSEASYLDSPIRSPRMTVINETNDTPKSNGSSQSGMRQRLRPEIEKLEVHAQGMLQTMEDAKEELLKPGKDGHSFDLTGESNTEKTSSERTLNKLREEKAKASIETKSDAGKQLSAPETPGTNNVTESKNSRQKTKTSFDPRKLVRPTKETSVARAKTKADVLKQRIRPKSGKSAEASSKSRVRTKGDSLKLRFRPKSRNPDSTESTIRAVKGLLKSEAGSKADARKRRNKSKARSPNGAVFDDPPKVEGETNTDTTHEANDEALDDRSSTSLDFRLTQDRDNSDKDSSDKELECDSSSSSASASASQKTESGLLENERGDKVINGARMIFFLILTLSAAAISLASYFLLEKEETRAFKNLFDAQAKELQLYTTHNVDNVFETLDGLSRMTTSWIKHSNNDGEWPSGFINVPDVRENIGLARNLTNSLVIAYMPKVQKEDYDKWINYSTTHKNWIAEEQPGGSSAVEPNISEFIWEFSDYYWEKKLNPGESLLDLNYSLVEEYAGMLKDKDDDQRALIEKFFVDMMTPRSLRGYINTEAQQLVSPQAKKQSIQTCDAPANPDRRRRLLAKKYDADRLLQSIELNSDMASAEAQTNDNKFVPPNPDDDNKFFSDITYSLSESSESGDDDEYDTGPEVPPASKGVADSRDHFYTPVWQIAPIPVINETSNEVPVINYNLADRLVFFKATEYMERSREPVFLDVCDQSAWFGIDDNREILQTVIAYPVMEDFSYNSTIVGYYTAIIPWKNFFENSLGDKTNNMIVVVNNTCGETFTINVTENRKAFVIDEKGDTHDEKYNDTSDTVTFAEKYNSQNFVEENFQTEICYYNMTMYPTAAFENAERTKKPMVTAVFILMVFLFTSFTFILFDSLVTKRQNKLLNTALRQNAIVNSLFPKNVQRKLMEEADATIEAAERNKGTKRRNLTTFLNDDQRGQPRKVDPFDSKPIADLFPHTTIMFADISGFTAWSSAREPAAVFTLLETIYRAFDEIAKRRKVFKVEVVGDCYVAVCGLPDPRKDHYAVMCRFAQDCMAAMHVHTKELEVRLGPDTGDLALRVGLHSGPVVAGVLRGDKSRFQLFGDTMNTASRMESTGTPNRIQLSQTTADLLITNGKEHWITKREDKVKAKGKGDLTTYFLLSVKKKTSSTNSASTSKIDEVVLVKSGNQSKMVKTVQKRNRVADWVVEMLGKLLKEMKAKRKLTGVRADSEATIDALENRSVGAGSSVGLDNKTVIDEVAECLKLPGLYKTEKGGSAKPKIPLPLDKEVMDELQHYVYSIASLYQKNPFHNFEHASHVSMSCIKLLNRIASHDEESLDAVNEHTYGICSDPLTSFAIVFSALIHDVDHCGVPNAQLVKEHSAVATMYKNKSVAEQNSIDIGWGLLMEPTYSNLRRHIYTTVYEYKCFRQIVVNCIMATDICDKDLIKARNKRWELAFSSNALSSRHSSHKSSKPMFDHHADSTRQTSYRKATVVIEHLIQLSDVSHTMQHWHMYRRWNERLFEEGYKAFIEGRAEKDPSENWYQGELGFYDFYIIPLAKKIKQCAVFGVSSDEYLSYAVANRQEWEERGREVVKDMLKKVETIYHTGNNAVGHKAEAEDSKEEANRAGPVSESDHSSDDDANAGDLEMGTKVIGSSSSSGPGDNKEGKLKALETVMEAPGTNSTCESETSISDGTGGDEDSIGSKKDLKSLLETGNRENGKVLNSNDSDATSDSTPV